MQQMETRTRHRPIGVTILAAVMTIEGVFELVLGIVAILAIFALGNAAATHGHTTVGKVVDVVGGTLGGISLVIGILTLIFAIGLWALKRWAFWLTIILQVIILVRHVFELIQPHTNGANIIIGMILPAIILLYFLLDPYVRRAFHV